MNEQTSEEVWVCYRCGEPIGKLDAYLRSSMGLHHFKCAVVNRLRPAVTITDHTLAIADLKRELAEARAALSDAKEEAAGYWKFIEELDTLLGAPNDSVSVECLAFHALHAATNSETLKLACWPAGVQHEHPNLRAP